MSDCGENMKPVSAMFPTKPEKPLVRLVDGKNKQEGRVEVFYAGKWGTVCDDDWDIKEAAIVCKELGFGRAVQATKHSKFRNGNAVIGKFTCECVMCLKRLSSWMKSHNTTIQMTALLTCGDIFCAVGGLF